MLPLTLGLLIGEMALLVLVLVVGIVMWAKRGMEKARVGLEEMAGGRTARLQTRANSFGIRSRGKAQWRGLGHLALFDDELVFVQALAGNHVRAKVADIQKVSTPRAFLGKTAGRKLLAVEWRVRDRTDQVAFFVSELDRWVAELEQLTRRAASSRNCAGYSAIARAPRANGDHWRPAVESCPPLEGTQRSCGAKG